MESKKPQTLLDLIRTMSSASTDEIIAAASAAGITWKSKSQIAKLRWQANNEQKHKGPNPKLKPAKKAATRPQAQGKTRPEANAEGSSKFRPRRRTYTFRDATRRAGLSGRP